MFRKTVLCPTVWALIETLGGTYLYEPWRLSKLPWKKKILRDFWPKKRAISEFITVVFIDCSLLISRSLRILFHAFACLSIRLLSSNTISPLNSLCHAIETKERKMSRKHLFLHTITHVVSQYKLIQDNLSIYIYIYTI